MSTFRVFADDVFLGTVWQEHGVFRAEVLHHHTGRMYPLFATHPTADAAASAVFAWQALPGSCELRQEPPNPQVNTDSVTVSGVLSGFIRD